MFSTWLQAVESVVSWVHNCFLSLWICTNFQALQNYKREQSCHLCLPRTYCMIIFCIQVNTVWLCTFGTNTTCSLMLLTWSFLLGEGEWLCRSHPSTSRGRTNQACGTLPCKLNHQGLQLHFFLQYTVIKQHNIKTFSFTVVQALHVYNSVDYSAYTIT